MTAAQPDNSSIAPDGSSHAVHFYENDDELSARVAAFIGEALLAGDPAVIIASPPHRQLFIARLAAMNVDVEAERPPAISRFWTRRRPSESSWSAIPRSRAVHTGRGQPHRIHRHARQPVGEGARLRRDGRPLVAGRESRRRDRPRGDVDGSRRHLSVRSALRLRDGGVRRRGRPARASARSAASTRTSRSPRRATEARTRPGRSAASTNAATVARPGRRDRAPQAGREGLAQLRAGAEARPGRRTRAGRARQAAGGRSQRDDPRQRAVHRRAGARSAGAADRDHDGRGAAQEAPGGGSRRAQREGRWARLMSSGERMSRMVEQLLDFTRLRVGGGFTIEPRDADLASLARQVVDELDDSYPGLRRRHPPDGRHTRQLGRRSTVPGALEPGGERVSARPSRRRHPDLHRRDAPRRSSACRCTTWARSRPRWSPRSSIR